MRLFTEHPAQVGESYTEHMAYAGSVGLRMVLAGLACMIHGLFPFLFQTTGSNAVARLHSLMMNKRNITYTAQALDEDHSVEESLIEAASRPLPTVKLDRAA